MDEIKTIHFIGVKGVGMAALAIFCKQKGYKISGSDESTVFVTDEELAKAEIPVLEFSPENLSGKPDLVIVSAAYSKENIEVKEARQLHLNVIAYSEALAKFSQNKRVIAVGGIHGKTTTTAMISYILSQANLDPSFIVGSGDVKSLKGSAHFGQGDFFVLEADEYKKSVDDSTPKFLDLSPEIEIITSIELDHPDMFPTEEDVYKAFYDFACKIPRKGFIVICLDYPKTRKLAKTIADRNFETYGFSEDAKWQIIEGQDTEEKTSFKLKNQEKIYGPFNLKMPGKTNILNAAATTILAQKLGISEKNIIKNLAEFEGVKRRYEVIGTVDGVNIIDDYAHHPRAIELTLESIKKRNPSSQLICIFQPHTFSRTKGLLMGFATAFTSADKVIITDIYASAREMEPTISGQDLATEIRKNQSDVKYIDDFDKIIDEVVDNIKKPAVIVTFGAGDIYKLAKRISEVLKNG